MPEATKWMETLEPGTPLLEAAAAVLAHRLETLEGWMRRAGSESYDDPVRAVHQTRVATRRAGAALAVFGDAIPPKQRKRLKKALRSLRRAAGAARDCDVHGALFASLDADAMGAEERAARDALLERIARERESALRGLRETIEEYTPSRVRERREAIVKAARRASIANDLTLDEAARETLPSMVADVRDLAASHHGEAARLHELRIACKRLRYATEIFAPCLGREFMTEHHPRLKETQDHLGAMNDAHTARLRIGRVLEDIGDEEGDADAFRRGLEALAVRLESREEAARVAFVEWWASVRGGDFLAPFERLEAGRPVRLTPTLKGAGSATIAPWPVCEAVEEASGAPEMDQDGPESRFGSRRVAAIDVGTNSVRMIVAEAFADGQYRVLHDEKDIARLGTGMAATRRLDDAAMERAVVTIERQRRIAEGYGATYIRAVGTAAVRDAENGRDLVDRVRERTGLSIEVISPDEEAHLTFRSVSAAFDLTSFPCVIADIGGGSAEVVLCSRGLIEQVFPVPLGAVGLTEKFGGPDACAGARFDEMVAHIRETLDEYFAGESVDAELLIGAGGTFEALAKFSMERFGPTPGALIRGYDMKRSEVKRILGRLRPLSVKERAKQPGISANRAEIIVAGAALVHALMKRTGVKRLRVHDGGIRDGLLLSMVQEMFPQDGGASAADDPRDPMRSVRRFSQVCNYERRHCAHVARLGLQVFDQLVSGHGLSFEGWDAARARVLFHAAALLHDVGYHIDYRQHHLHGYHLIMHSGLRGFSRRELEVIGQVARYHRKGLPKLKHKPFAKLAAEDRALVRTLGAILRLADGLDRTHMRLVRSITLRIDHGAAMFDLEAENDPAVDIWGAERKADLWTKVFGLRPEFRWANAPEPAETDEPVGAATA